MNRVTFGFLILSGFAFAAAPQAADAQVVMQVGLYWEFGDDGWRAYRPAYEPVRDGVYYAPPREVVYYTPQRAVKVPRGHLPPPGYCRLWYPGRPPGHQPRARPCEELFGFHGYGDAVILGAPDFRVARWDDGDDNRGSRGRRGNGNGNGKRGR